MKVTTFRLLRRRNISLLWSTPKVRRREASVRSDISLRARQRISIMMIVMCNHNPRKLPQCHQNQYISLSRNLKDFLVMIFNNQNPRMIRTKLQQPRLQSQLKKLQKSNRLQGQRKTTPNQRIQIHLMLRNSQQMTIMRLKKRNKVIYSKKINQVS